MDDGEALSLCPSFNSYASGRISEIATKVAEESNGSRDDDDDNFEFALVRGDPEAQVREVFPIFNRDLLIGDHDRDRDGGKADVSSMRLTLKDFFIEDREERDDAPSSSSSSSEADELEGVAPGTYCVWRPKDVEASQSRCKKSNSTGSASKRWKFRDLLRRSNSEGKDTFVLLNPKNRAEKVENSKERRRSVDGIKFGAGKVKAKGVSGEKVSTSSAHEEFYVRNRATKEGDKRKSYLPYRQDLVGLFANVNGVGRTFPPF